MTREESIKSALKFLVRIQQKQGSWGYSDNDDNEVSWDEIIEWVDSRNMTSKALDVPVTNVVDLISRQAARNALLNKGQHSKRYKLGETWELNLMEIEEALGELPSVVPERKTGRWIMNHDKNAKLYGKCSNCGMRNYAGYTNYCPDCGAKMGVDE